MHPDLREAYQLANEYIILDLEHAIPRAARGHEVCRISQKRANFFPNAWLLIGLDSLPAPDAQLRLLAKQIRDAFGRHVRVKRVNGIVYVFRK